ncbi:T9SS type A sorting domain-containing protein [Ekhidna sp. To15]|uniref:T9SS type A sorting domain-containing protein n=1 Tax=Ekhidna sp. To15 TaxID=3395267 RepID=UPI003F51DE79
MTLLRTFEWVFKVTKNSKKDMKTKVKLLTTAALMFLSAATSAQSEEEESKIVIEITKEINGEKKTFKGEYNSTEEMRADPQYQEFAGEEQEFDFWFDDEEDKDVFLHLDQLRNHHGSAFKFFHKGGDEDDNQFFFKHFDGDSVNSFFDLSLDGMDIEEYREKLNELGIEMEMLFDRMDDDEGQRRHVRSFVIKRVKITDVDNEFGKKGKVDESNVLDLEDLVFFPNPSSNGRFKVRFRLPQEGELSIKVSNLEGKEVFSRYFERFGGTYSEMIDLSGQKDGIYLMEIGQGKKRVTKKIIIN